MRRTNQTIPLFVALGVFAFTAVADAEIGYDQYMNATYLASGQNHFDGTHTENAWTEGGSTGSAAACVWLSGVSQTCGGEGQWVSESLYNEHGTTYLHNHSTWNSYFNATTAYTY
jgi:hypothetical protein